MSASEIAAAPVSGTGPRVIENQTPQRGIFINFPDLYLKSRLYWMPLKKKATSLSLSLFFLLPVPRPPTSAACQVLLTSLQAVTKRKFASRCAVMGFFFFFCFVLGFVFFFLRALSVCVSVVIGCETCHWSQRQSLGLFTVIKLSRAVIHDTLSKSCYHVEGKKKKPRYSFLPP